jgi:hypothetical protein
MKESNLETGSRGGKPDTLKGVCPVWEGLSQDRSVEAEYGVAILPHHDRISPSRGPADASR